MPNDKLKTPPQPKPLATPTTSLPGAPGIRISRGADAYAERNGGAKTLPIPKPAQIFPKGGK